jgi:ATP-dependent DNA helicase RecG
MMIKESAEYSLAEPDFAQSAGEFVVTLWRDWLSESTLSRFNLNDRQYAAISQMKSTRQITNSEYRDLTGVSKRTAARDLEELVGKGLLARTTTTGRGAAYRLERKRTTNAP